jgi:hypothetical protein
MWLSCVAENAATSPPTPGIVLPLVGVQARGVANLNGVLKLKGTLVIPYTGYLSLDFPPTPPKMATTQLHNPLSDLDSKYCLSP